MPRQPITTYDPNGGTRKVLPPLNSFNVRLTGDPEDARRVLRKFQEIAPDVCERTFWIDDALDDPLGQELGRYAWAGAEGGPSTSSLNLWGWRSGEGTAFGNLYPERPDITVEEFLNL